MCTWPRKGDDVLTLPRKEDDVLAWPRKEAVRLRLVCPATSHQVEKPTNNVAMLSHNAELGDPIRRQDFQDMVWRTNQKRMFQY